MEILLEIIMIPAVLAIIKIVVIVLAVGYFFDSNGT